MTNEGIQYKNSLVIPAGAPVETPPLGDFILFVAVSGSASIRLGTSKNAPVVPVRNLAKFKGTFGARTAHIESAAGATVSFYYGQGDVEIASAGGTGGTVNDVTGNVDDPNVAGLTPADTASFAFYVKDQVSPVVMWGWSVAGQTWFPIMT